MSFIGIDLGATFLKGAWLHPETGTLSSVVRAPFPSFAVGRISGRREVSADLILAVVVQLIQQLMYSETCPCQGLFICGQMHGLVITNPVGSQISDFISWQDGRSSEVGSDGRPFFEIAGEKLSFELRSQLGNEFRPGLPLTTLHAMRCQGELPLGSVPLSLMDYIAAKLCHSEPATHPTNAAAHGLLDVTELSWSLKTLTALGLEDLCLPRIQSEEKPVGLCRIDGCEFPVYTAVGDQQAALLGSRLSAGELSLNVATGSQVSILTDSPYSGDWQLRPYFDNLWLRTVTHLPAGRALNRLVWLCSELATDQGTPIVDPWEQITRLSANVNPRHLMVDLAFFPSVYGNSGSIQNMFEEEIGVGSLFCAAFRSMADNYLFAATRIAAAGWSRVVFSGGLVQKLPLLRHEILNRLGSECRTAHHEEDTLTGLCILAGRVSSST